MRNAEWDHVSFKTYIVDAAANIPGVTTQADIARAIGISGSLLSKWFAGREIPSPESLKKVTAALPGAVLDDLLKLTGHIPADGHAPSAPALRAVHPLARELDDMLDEGSPIAVVDREALGTLVDRVMQPYRRTMRRRRSA